MVRTTRIAAVLLLLGLATGASCGPVAPPEQRLTLAGGSVGGGWGAVSEGLAEALRRSFPSDWTVSTIPGTSAGNVIRLHRGEVNLAMTHTWVVRAATAGEEPFREPLSNIRTLARIYPSVLQLIMASRVGVTSLDELISRRQSVRLSVHERGSGNQLAVRRLLEESGMAYDTLESWGGRVLFSGTGESVDQMRDGHLDGYGLITTLPVALVTELMLTHPFRLLSLDPRIVRTMEDKYGYEKFVIRAGTYPRQDEDVLSFSYHTVLVARSDLPDDVAYDIVRGLIEELDYLANVHPTLRAMNPAQMQERLEESLHPGAARAYHEHSLMAGSDGNGEGISTQHHADEDINR